MTDKNSNEIIKTLLTTKSKKEACKLLGISESTLYRLLKDPDFLEKLEDAQNKLYNSIIYQLICLSRESINSLSELITNPKTSAVVKLKASQEIINTVFKVCNYEDLQKRIEKIEKRLGI